MRRCRHVLVSTAALLLGSLASAQTAGPVFCPGDGTGPVPCPCSNTGAPGKGCNNSFGTGGAQLVASGATHPDTIVLTSSGELPTALSVFLQGNLSAKPSAFGDGVRCVYGSIKRIGVVNASAGVATYPGPGDPSVGTQSANLGDPLQPGATRWYQTYYRDPDVVFCPSLPGNSFNVSSGVALVW